MENIMYARKPRRNTKVYLVCLFLSFLWLSIYPTSIGLMDSFHYGFGNILSSVNFGIVFAALLAETLASWITFEILFWIYRWVLSFKIYSFIVPMESLKAETRLYFIYRNVILGVIYNLCFVMPYLFAFSMFFDLIVTMIVLICYAKQLNERYSETIVGHFVFKNFCYPIFIYEAIEVLCSVLVVL